MGDDHDSVASMPDVGWWIAYAATWVSISFSAVAYVCQRFADRNMLDMTDTEHRFVMQVGEAFGFVALGWIVISGILAILSRVRYGIASGTTLYLLQLVFSIGAITALPALTS